MKKLSVILMAIALVMGFTQCKKENVNGNGNGSPVLEGETYTISLSLGTGSNAKAGVVPVDGDDVAPVQYEVNDTIYVAYNGQHAGKLVCRSVSTTAQTGAVQQHDTYMASFEGDVTLNPTIEGQKLYFYFLGNNKPKINSNGQYVVDLSDQSDHLPVISYAASVEDFDPDVTNYSVQYNWLMNQCALVKFDFENIYDKYTDKSTQNDLDQNTYAIYTTTQDITLYGLKNQVSITLNNNEFLWGSKDEGAIKLYKASADDDTKRFAIIPDGTYNISEGDLEVDFDYENDPYGFFGTYRLQGQVELNDYFQSGDDSDDGNQAKLDLVWHSGAFLVATVGNPGEGTGTYDPNNPWDVSPIDINSNEFGNPYYVVFSRGNLQYNVSNNTWRFAKHQYDYVGGCIDDVAPTYELIGNVVLDPDDAGSPAMGTTYSYTYNIFQSSEVNAQNRYNAFAALNRSDNEQIATEYYTGLIDLFGWGTGENPRNASKTNSDYENYKEWGYNYITNSGKPNDNNFWNSLDRAEWQYLLEERDNAQMKFGFATVEGVHGLVLLPELWSAPTGFTFTNAQTNQNFDAQTFSAATWKEMEKKGAVFLPAAGYRGSGFTSGNSGLTNNTDFDGGTTSGIGTGGSNQDHGAYWSSSKATQVTNASCFYMRFGGTISGSGDHVNAGYYMAPDNGNSVRLVRYINKPTTTTGGKFFPKKN